VYRNLILTMTLGGLWHGSRWTFVVWGLLHGLALVAQREWTQWTAGWKAIRESAAAKAVGAIVTFYFICICWIFFRAADLAKPMDGSDFSRALLILRAFTGLSWGSDHRALQTLDPRLLLLFAGLVFVHWLNYRRVFSTWWRRCPGLVFAFA